MVRLLLIHFFITKEGNCVITQWGQVLLNFYKIINLDIRTIEIVY